MTRSQERAARRIEAVEELVEIAVAERAQPIAGVERRALAQEALELEVRQQRLEHERAHVEARGDVVLRDHQLVARRACEQLVEQSRERLAARRVAVGEVLEHRHVVGAGEQLARRRLAVAPGAADLLRVALESLGQVVVVDVAHVGLVDAHAERDRRDHDAVAGAGPPFLDWPSRSSSFMPAW